ncbi:MAG: GntR family transcriptional regulator [Erysipelotrichaceae bacterium]|nr:GntR family transcriptional regulator [Erysipelotrichaceae bacterium]MBQ5755997.1 GntR family transcriptional regulator [Erysipelotrichaceae bacterium]
MFYINLQGKQPIYEQIRQQIIRFVELGILKPNEQLPSVRQLAQENGINPNTVAKAYQELEKEGVIYTLQKKGAYVAEKRYSGLYDHEQLIKYLKPLKDGGVRKEELAAAVEELFKEEN